MPTLLINALHRQSTDGILDKICQDRNAQIERLLQQTTDPERILYLESKRIFQVRLLNGAARMDNALQDILTTCLEKIKERDVNRITICTDWNLGFSGQNEIQVEKMVKLLESLDLPNGKKLAVGSHAARLSMDLEKQIPVKLLFDGEGEPSELNWPEKHEELKRQFSLYCDQTDSRQFVKLLALERKKKINPNKVERLLRSKSVTSTAAMDQSLKRLTSTPQSNYADNLISYENTIYPIKEEKPNMMGMSQTTNVSPEPKIHLAQGRLLASLLRTKSAPDLTKDISAISLLSEEELALRDISCISSIIGSEINTPRMRTTSTSVLDSPFPLDEFIGSPHPTAVAVNPIDVPSLHIDTESSLDTADLLPAPASLDRFQTSTPAHSLSIFAKENSAVTSGTLITTIALPAAKQL